MATVSDRTKQCKRRLALFSFLHFLCLFGPFLYFIPYGYIIGETTQKISMSLTIVTSLILAAVSFIISATHRSGLHRCIMWILILGVLICLKNIETFIIIMAICSVLDELIFVKCKDHYKAALLANKEIDRRS